MSDTVVKILKLTNGQEIIAKVLQTTGDYFVVTSPLSLQPMRGGEGMSIGLLPFSWGGRTDKVMIHASHIICDLEPEDNLESQYLAGLAGITLASAQPPTTGKLHLVE